MKSLLSLLFLCAIASGCGTSLSCMLEREGVFQVGEIVDVATQRERLSRDYSLVEEYLGQRISELNRSSAEHAAELQKIAVQRLAAAKDAHLKQMQTWDEFASGISDGDVVLLVKGHSRPVRYYIALRRGKIVRRSKEESTYGLIE